MRHLVVPKLSGQALATDQKGWEADAEMSLGGVFYDHIRTSSGATVGVRYWVMDVVFAQHPVFRCFLEDERFQFDPQNGHVDLVFEEKDVDAFVSGALEVDCAQDFGGEGVVRRGDLFGITFDLE